MAKTKAQKEAEAKAKAAEQAMTEDEALQAEEVIEDVEVAEEVAEAPVKGKSLPDVKQAGGKFEVVSQDGQYRGYNEKGQAVTPVVSNVSEIAKQMVRAEALRVARLALKPNDR